MVGGASGKGRADDSILSEMGSCTGVVCMGAGYMGRTIGGRAVWCITVSSRKLEMFKLGIDDGDRALEKQK